jgi:hypothetical protein
MQKRPLALVGTDASSAALKSACSHQHGDALALVPAIAHRFGPPHSGQEEAEEVGADMQRLFYGALASLCRRSLMSLALD